MGKMKELYENIFGIVIFCFFVFAMVGFFYLSALSMRSRVLMLDQCEKDHGDEIIRLERECISNGGNGLLSSCKEDAIDFFCKKTTN